MGDPLKIHDNRGELHDNLTSQKVVQMEPAQNSSIIITLKWLSIMDGFKVVIGYMLLPIQFWNVEITKALWKDVKSIWP